MTNKRILELAYHGALDVWTEMHAKASRRGADMIAKHREEIAWKEVQEITHLLKAEELKEAE